MKTGAASQTAERRSPIRRVGNDRLETRRVGDRRSNRAVHGPAARPRLEIEATHEPRSAVRPGCELRQRPAARTNARRRKAAWRPRRSTRDAWRTRRRGRLRYLTPWFMAPTHVKDLEVFPSHEPRGSGVSAERRQLERMRLERKRFAALCRDAATVDGPDALAPSEIPAFRERERREVAASNRIADGA